MTCNFRVGQKVVCVDDNWSQGYSPLAKGRVYTVKGIYEDWGYYVTARSIVSGDGLILEEAVNPTTEEGGFSHLRFRPVVERKTDISIFRALLTPSKEKVETAS